MTISEEIGIGQISGTFTKSGYDYNSLMITQNFATSGSNYFITGVAFNDTDHNAFYSVGEGRNLVSVSAPVGDDTDNLFWRLCFIRIQWNAKHFFQWRTVLSFANDSAGYNRRQQYQVGALSTAIQSGAPRVWFWYPVFIRRYCLVPQIFR